MQEPEVTHANLFKNLALLKELLFKTLKREVKTDILSIFDLAESLFTEGSTIETTFTTFWQALDKFSNEDILFITRVFSHFLNLTNIAEQYHRIRRRRWHLGLGHPPQAGSLQAVIPALLSKGISSKTLKKTIESLNIELVLTAHPTEVTRRTLIHKHTEIAKWLDRLDREDLMPSERERVIESLQQEITACWKTEEIRQKKPSVLEEAKWGFAVVEESLWQAIPEFLRELDKQLAASLGERLKQEAVPIRFGSWMGGDRDGNPKVTATITREVILLARWKAADLYEKDIIALRESLSMHECNDEMRAIVGEINEPYRALLRRVRDRLSRTKFWAECQIEQREICPSGDLIFLNKQDLLEPLLLCYRSLQDIGAGDIAEGKLLDVIRRIYCFGLNLFPLDIRQQAEKHSELLDALTQIWGGEGTFNGSYLNWSESERLQFLIKELQNPTLTFQTYQNNLLSEDCLEYLNTFRVIFEQPRDSLGAYIISMTQHTSDILAVLFLQKLVGVANPLRIVPLFETLNDLNNAHRCMAELFQIEVYQKACKGVQEVMIGYSDSAKDAGFLGASWAQYQALEALLEVGKAHGIQMIFFHGRGGSVGRGGGPSHIAIQSQPPGTLGNKLRVTQQGEIIRHRLGMQKIAERTFSIYTTATLEALLFPNPSPKPEWRAIMEKLSKVSIQAYQTIVKKTPEFLSYFSNVTPIQELDKISIASRPARRQTGSDVQNLRAIPWVFAWTQNRLLLPAWLGVGNALEGGGEAKEGTKVLKTLKKEWVFFSALLSMVEMGLGIADPFIEKQYEVNLCPNTLWALGESLRQSFNKTEEKVLQILEQNKILETNVLLSRSIGIRRPYLSALHALQIKLLKNFRENPDDTTLEKALLVSITGIATGMHNMG